MTTKIGLHLAALALCASLITLLRAGEPAGSQKSGRVLVLDTERTLEGNVERMGTQYRVRRGAGEVWVQPENVLRLCTNHEEAYQFLRARANLRDPDEHLRLAQWCHLHGLRKQALDEVTAAVELRPDHPASQRLMRSLQRSSATGATASPTTRPHEESEVVQSPLPITTESLSLFVTRLQPLLMNACASCHSTGRGGAFKLTRAYDAGAVSRKTTLQNLSVVLGQINPEQPQASPLLVKAVSIHGDMVQPAIKSREVAAYHTLEEWVRVTLETSPHQTEPRLTSATSLPAAAPRGPIEPAGVKPVVSTSETTDGNLATATKSTATAASFGELHDAKAAAKAAPPPEPVDAFDPLIFNRQMHPERVDQKKP